MLSRSAAAVAKIVLVSFVGRRKEDGKNYGGFSTQLMNVLLFSMTVRLVRTITFTLAARSRPRNFR